MASPRCITASAPGKVILFGEHSILYGSEALACAIDLRTTVILKFDPQATGMLPGCIRVHLSDLSEREVTLPIDGSTCPLPSIESSEELASYRVVQCLANSILDASNRSGLALTVSSTIPRAAGLGSSGALCAAIAAAFYRLQYGHVAEDDIFQLAMEGECVLHGSPSGLDHFTSIHGSLIDRATGPLTFYVIGGIVLRKADGMLGRIEGVEGTDLSHGAFGEILVVNTGRGRSTKRQIEKFRESTRTDEGQMALEHLQRVVGEAIIAVRRKDHNRLPSIIRCIQENLQNLNVSCEEIDKIRAILRARLGLEAKISGAGGGGCLVVFPFPKTLEEELEATKSEITETVPSATLFCIKVIEQGLLVSE